MTKIRKKCIALGCVVAIVAAAACMLKFYIFDAYNHADVRVEIPAGASEDDVREIFEDALGSGFGNKVFTMWKMQDGTPVGSHGSYLVRHGEKAVKIARNIAKGRQTPVRLTFNNLRQIQDFAGRAARVIEADSATVMAAVASTLARHGYHAPEYAATILPDTYEFYWTTDPVDVVETLLKHRNAFWNDERRARARALGLSPAQVHTLASIVEEETAQTDERPVIARLYLNRLDKDMFLQADPTVKFAVKCFDLKRITGEYLNSNSAYNTYKFKGLPPGPIRIVEAASLDAVLNAPEHDYLYMCARSDFSGYHDFATDYNRHRINAARYHAALNSRGIK